MVRFYLPEGVTAFKEEMFFEKQNAGFDKITSRSNEKIKLLTFLNDRRERESRRLFFFEGGHLLEEYLRAKLTPWALFFTSEAYEKYGGLINHTICSKYMVTREVYKKATCEKSPQGVLCVSGFLPNIIDLSKEDAGESAKTLPGGVILESIRDAGNLGGIIRTAAGLGISSVIVSRDCADLYSPKTLRASMGALFFTKIMVSSNIPELITVLEGAGRKVYAASPHGSAFELGEKDISPRSFIVLGNEGEGVSEPAAAVCSGSVKIPMGSGAESLNVAAASAILLWEMVRNKKS